MRFGKIIFAKKLLSLLVLITIIYPVFQPPIARGFSFFGFFGTSEEEKNDSRQSSQNSNKIKQDKLIAILVEEELIEDAVLASAIDRYAVDSASAIGGRSIVIPIPKNTSVKEIYEGLAHLYFMGDENNAKSKLVGTVLIGNIPIPVVEKSGNLWPTIFPYTDFEKRVYLWDKEKKRFVFNNGAYMEPEIWHGVIRSQKDNIELQSNEILKFLEENHKVHTGETSFADNLFYVNTADEKSVPTFLEEKYNKWLLYIKDIAYMHFSKTLLEDIEAGEMENDLDTIDTTIITDLMDSAGVSKEIAEGIISGEIKTMPDVLTEMIISVLADNYLSSNEAQEKLLKDMIGKAGAWKDEFDTTMKLIAKKDMASVEKLKEVNDLIETNLYKQLEKNNLAGDITIPHTVELEDPITKELLKKPLYWNGVNRKEMTAKDCTLYRGSTATKSHPYAQKVEANRTLNLETIGSCANANEIDSIKYADKYEGCCAENIKYDGISATYDQCDTKSQWYYGRVSDNEYDHQGAELPVFDLGGTQLGEGPDGAFGCDELLTKDNEDSDMMKRFDSLVLHVEPTQETIDKQKETLAQFLPVDDPRGFSFYDYQNNFYRFDFLNIFDLQGKISSKEQLEEEIKKQLENEINKLNNIIKTASGKSEVLYNQDKEVKYPVEMFEIPVGYEGECNYSISPKQIDKFTKKIIWNELCKYHEIQEEDLERVPSEIIKENKIVRFYEYGTLIPDSFVKHILDEIDIDKLYSSFDWLGQTLNEKNKKALEYALGDVSNFSSFLDYDFNGYELAHITTSISNGDILPMDFKVATNEFDKDFYVKKAKGILSKISSNKSFESKSKPKHKVDLSNKKLTSSLERIFVSKNDLNPIPITFSLKNKYEEIDVKNYTSEIALNFSSSDVDQFFDIFPDKKLKVTAGKASFFLKPKKQDFGGKLTIQAYVPQTELLTEEIPIMITRYDTLIKTEKQDLVVTDTNGTLLTVYIYNSAGKTTKRFDGKYLKFISEDGTFQGGIDNVEIQEGKAEIRFLPGRKAGMAKIIVIDEEMKLPDSEIKINIKPGEPRYLKFKNTSKFLLPISDYQDITVQLTDRYDNDISIVSQELSWKVEKGEIENEKEKDEDPRKKGVQEWIHKGKSFISIRPINKTGDKIRLSVSSSILPKDAAISKEFTVIKNPILKTKITKKSVSVDSLKPIKIKLEAQNENGELIDYDFNVNVSVTPLDFLEYEKELVMKSGFGEFKFYPGEKAGKYTIVFSIDGFENVAVDVDIVAGNGKKLQMTTTKKTWDSDVGSIPVDILMLDNFGNRVKSNEKISLTVSEKTKELISVPASELFLRNGKTTVGVKTKGKSGEAHLIVEGNNVSSDSLELSIESSLSVDDISKKFNPNVKFMVLSGSVGGNLFLDKNVATALLFAGKTQAVSTMGVPYENATLGYGFVGQSGNVSNLLNAKFIFEQNIPEVLLLSQDKIIAKVRMIYANNPNIYKGDIKEDIYGIYINLEKENFKLLNDNLYFEDQLLLSFTKKGGINIESGDMDLEIIDNNLTKWNILKNNEIIGTITYNLPHKIFAKDNYVKDDFQGLWLKSINADMDFDSIFTGNSTLGEKGFLIKDKSEISSSEKRLGSSKKSTEDTQLDSDIVWENSNWKPAVLFAGGNNIGISTQRGGSDTGLLLGDPTLSRLDFTPREDDKTMGISFWKSTDGDIKDVSYTDINEDGNLDLLLQVNNKIIGLYQTADGTGEFVEEIIVSEVEDGIKSIGSLTSETSDVTSKKGIVGFIQINENGDFVLHQNDNGTMITKKIPFGQKFEEIKTANLNGDMYTDIVGMDKNQKLWRILGEEDGFDKPKLLDDFSPKFDKVDEKNTDKNTKYLSGIKLEYKTEESLINTQNLSDSVLTSSLKINSDDTKLRIGGRLSTKLNITTPVDLESLSIIIPAYKNIEFETNSLNCVSCEKHPTVKIDQKTGGMLIKDMSLDAKSKLTLIWKSKVKSLPTTEFFIGDFENGKDSLDDISVPWNFGGRSKVLKFLSSKQQTQGYNRLVASLNNIDVSSPNIEIENLSEELLSKENNIMDSNMEDIEELLSQKTSYPSISSLFDDITVDSTNPSKDFLSMAAGIEMDNTMPKAKPNGMSGGSPIYENKSKTYRLYVVPTTTGKTAIASCVGLKEIFMKSPVWNPNCTVKILDYQSSSTSISSSLKTSGVFSLEEQDPPNKNLFAVDIVTQWLKDQWRELTYNIHRALPRVSFNPPDLTKSPSNDNFNTDINKYELLQQELLKSKFINIQKIPVIISILDLDRLSEVAAVDVSVDIDLSSIKERIKNPENEAKIMADIRSQINDYEKEQKKNLEEQLDAKINEFTRSYDTLKKDLFSLREKNIELLEHAVESSNDLTKYFESWISKNNEKIDEWKLYASIWSSLTNVLKELTIEFFISFEKKYATTAIDRGTWLPWLYETISGTIDIPITKVTPYPDKILNTTEVTFGTDIKIADVELKESDVDLHELVDLFVNVPLEKSAISLSGDRVSINFPTANLPEVKFPELQTIIIPETDVFKGMYDNLDDQLKILPSPPEIPISELITNISEVMTKPILYEKLFGELRRGIAQVPEWGLKSYIEQLTNEISLDIFFTGKLDPPPVNEVIPDKDIIEDNYKREKVDFFKFLNDFLVQNKDFDRVALHDKFEKDNKEIKDLYQNLVYENKILKQLVTKSSNEFFADKEVEKIFMKEHKYFAANKVTDSTKATTKKINNEIYANNIQNNLLGETKTLTKDIDGDGVEEVFYTNGPELFVKYNVQRTHENIQSKKINKWTYDEFKAKREVSLGMEVNSRGLSFKPFDENVSYYELFFSERPDSLFEMALFPSERKSKVWKRYALAKQNLFKNYKISKNPVRVTKVKGSPKINMVKPKELMTYSEEKCQNPDVKKSFFSSRTILMATEDDTRLSIRVPAIAFKPAEYQIIRLEKGESTSIDYGKVCVFSGKLESADLSEDKELFEVKVGQMITSDMELSMNQGDFVQFQTSGNSLVSVFDKDEYKLRFFDGEEQEISLMLNKNDLRQNLYGFLIGFIDEQKTLVRRKIFFNATY